MKALMSLHSALTSHFLSQVGFLKAVFVLVACSSSVSLGASNAGDVAAVYVIAGLLLPLTVAALGGAAIRLGVCTFSKRVVRKVGARLVQLDPLSALIVVLAKAPTLNVACLSEYRFPRLKLSWRQSLESSWRMAFERSMRESSEGSSSDGSAHRPLPEPLRSS